MASEFAKLFQRGAQTSLHRLFGDSVTYTPPAGSVSETPVALSYVIASEIRKEKRYDDEGTTWVATRSFSLVTDSSADRYCGVTEVLRGGKIAYGGETFVVESAEVNTAAGTTVARTQLHTIARRTRPGLRSNR